MRNRILAFASAIVLAGCVSGYTKFYHPMNGATPEAIAARRIAPPPAVPAVEHWSGTPDEAYKHFAESGYVPIGYVSFNGAHGSDSEAIAQGRKVQADLVVVMDPRYTGTRTTAMPLVTPTTNTSTTNSTATAYGSGGYATAYGTSTTTSYGTQTTVIPISTDRFDFGAIYMVKTKAVFGAFFRDINDDERQQLGSNRGVYILTIVNDTPAFNADILPGDIITSFNGERVSQETFQRLLTENRGKSVTIGIHRASGDVEKLVTLNN